MARAGATARIGTTWRNWWPKTMPARWPAPAAKPLHPPRLAFQHASLLAGVRAAHWRQLYLLCKPMGRRNIVVAFHEHSPDNEHRIVRRRNLCHSLRHGSFPARAADQVIASLGSRGAFADVGKISVVRRISELHTVVAAGHVRHMQDLRP